MTDTCNVDPALTFPVPSTPPPYFEGLCGDTLPIDKFRPKRQLSAYPYTPPSSYEKRGTMPRKSNVKGITINFYLESFDTDWFRMVIIPISRLSGNLTCATDDDVV